MPKKEDRWDAIARHDYDRNHVCAGYYDGEWPKATAKLLRRQFSVFVRMVRERGNEYMKDASDSTLSKAMQVSAASRGWAFKDFADDLIAFSKKGGR